MILLVFLTAAAAVPVSVAGPTFSRMHSFGSPPDEGVNPFSALTLGSDGNFYGTAYSGGSGGNGTVFRMTPTGAISNLHTFTGTFVAGDGSHPYAPLLLASDGNFYGTTVGGGTFNNGSIFRISPSGVFTNLFSFISGQGSQPYGGLVQGNDGRLYGTTWLGVGTVFRIDLNGSNFMTLHTFSGPDGSAPHGGLTRGSDGNFYGTTEKGGTNSWNKGTVFKITSDGTFTHLHSFSPTDGSYPESALIQGRDGYFYGTTRIFGGPDDSAGGTVFRIGSTGDFTVIYTGIYCNTNTCAPWGSLLQASDGNFYGTSFGGGQTTNNCFCGTVYRLTPQGDYTLLYSFSGTDGSNPYSSLIEDAEGNLFGTTELGGQYGDYGTVFKLSGAVLRAPQLQLSRTAGTINLQWPTNFAGFTAQANPTVANSNSWSDLTNVPAVSGANYSITLPATNNHSFFRLRSN